MARPTIIVNPLIRQIRVQTESDENNRQDNGTIEAGGRYEFNFVTGPRDSCPMVRSRLAAFRCSFDGYWLHNGIMTVS